MLKAQLRSKIFQLEISWHDVEDILTGDLFGILDYLPRNPFLRDFVQRIVGLNSCSLSPTLEGVSWEEIELVLWPRFTVDDEQTEPDVLIVSNKWVIVVEVKLESGLGHRQPWREYLVGKEVARDRGLSVDAIYYVLITTRSVDVGATFTANESAEREELVSRTHYVRWSNLIEMTDNWLTAGLDDQKLSPDRVRMLEDLAAALRLRRTLSFAGFTFPSHRDVVQTTGRIFSPERFQGFMADKTSNVEALSTLHNSDFGKFCTNGRPTEIMSNYLDLTSFAGFLLMSGQVLASEGTLGFATRPVRTFAGFLEYCLACEATHTLGLSTDLLDIRKDLN